MKITCISVAPIFVNRVIGGSQKILIEVMQGLSKKGHRVQILATHNGTEHSEFKCKDIVIKPILKFRGAFPSTHQVPPYDLVNNRESLHENTVDSDVVFLHGDSLFIRPDFHNAKIIRSLHDYVYEESLLSSLLLPADITVVPSKYLKKTVETTVVMSNLRDLEDIVVIPNGVSGYLGPKTRRIPSRLENRNNDDLVILFPHRTDRNKGFTEAVNICNKLQEKICNKTVRLFIPFYTNDKERDQSSYGYSELQQIINDLDTNNVVELHNWLNIDEVHRYLSLGDVVINPGPFIESFGLIPLESVLAGTPAVCSRVGALRDLEGIPGLYHVDYGDIDGFVEKIIEAINVDQSTLDDGKDHVETVYSIQSMIDGYDEVMKGSYDTTKKMILDENYLVLAPWCYKNGNFIYNDYSSKFHHYPKLNDVFSFLPGTTINLKKFSSPDILMEINKAREEGCLTPLIV
jgi:glycosyltransferase involved in cell wall biosynthesis